MIDENEFINILTIPYNDTAFYK